MTATEKLSDLSINTQHLIERYKNSVISTMLLFFKNMEKKVNKEITNNYDVEHLTIVEKNKLKKRLNEIQTIELSKIRKQILKDSHKLLGTQASLYDSQLKDVLSSMSEYIKIKKVDEKTLKHLYDKSPITMEKGKYSTLNSLWATFFVSVKNNLNQNTESAYRLKKSTREYTNDLNRGYKIGENSLNSVIAVMIQQAAQVTLRAINEKNNDIINGYIWVSVLDSHTSPVCQDYSGLEYYYDRPDLSTLPHQVYPPIHYKCRSSTSPIIKTYQELGIPVSELNDSQKELMESNSIQVKTYNEWFIAQTPSVQRSLLGKTRYDAWQQGSFKVTRFNNNGQRLTLKQLESKGIIS